MTGNQDDLCTMATNCFGEKIECVAHDLMAAPCTRAFEDFDNCFFNLLAHIRLRHVR